MPRIIDVNDPAADSLGDCLEALHSLPFDPADEESLAFAARCLRRLDNNRTFLGDLLIDQLRAQNRVTGVESGYSPQAIVLSPMRDGVFLRANIWPSEQDSCFRTSGARSFVYGVPHDHNFSFLTSGYLGPGYRSDYFEYDYETVAGFAGEKAPLKFKERGQLTRGKLMLYRAHVDIHNQIPPESLSVSLNIMHIDPLQSWHDQYGFDLEKGAVTRVLSPNSTEVFLRTAVATGHAEALDLAETFGRNHPSDRMRLASYEARALLQTDTGARDTIWREAERSGSRMVSETAKQRREELA